MDAVTSYVLDDPEFESTMGKRFFSIPKLSDRLSGPPGLLFKGHGVGRAGCKRVLAPKL